MNNRINHSDNLFLKMWDCRICRIGILVFTSLLFLVFLLSIISNPVFKWIILPKILNSINSESKNKIHIEAADFSFFQNKFTGHNTTLILIDSEQSNKDSINIKVPYFSISGISWFALLFGNGYSFGNIIIDKPEIRINNYIYSNGLQKDSSANNNSDSLDLSLAQQFAKLIPEKINPLEIDRLIINSASIVRIIQDKDKTIDSVKNLSLTFSDINLDKKAKYKSGKNSLISNYEIIIKEFHRKMYGPGYDFKIFSINLSGSKSLLEIKGLSFRPYISDEEFFNRKTYRGDRWIIKMPEITSHQIDIIKFLNDNIIRADSLIIPKFEIEIFTNKRLPLNPYSDPKMPHELITSLGFGIEISKFITNKSSLILESLVPNVNRRAQLRFTDINTEINNISNTPERQTFKNPCIINASGNLQGKGELKVNLTYPLLSEKLSFGYKGSLGEMEASFLNSHLEVENKASIESGKITGINFSSDIQNGIASVNIIPLYNNLKIKLLDETGKEEKVLQTFLANLIQIRESNPDDDDEIKSGNTIYNRGPNDVFLDVIWLALLQGLSEVVGF